MNQLRYRAVLYLRIARHFDAIVGGFGVRRLAAAFVSFTGIQSGGKPPHSKATTRDMTAARASGMDVAVIASDSSSPKALRQARPDYFLNQFSELLEVVRVGAPVA